MKTKNFLLALSLAVVFGCGCDCDNDSFKLVDKTVPIYASENDLVFSYNAADTVITVGGPLEWYVDAFALAPLHHRHEVTPEDVILKKNTTHGATLSYEWIEATKKDNTLRLHVAENTSDTVRLMRITLGGDAKTNVRGTFVYLSQNPKEKE
ncbi:MAG: hypothetical protein LBP64_02275 [Tannerella sp.]|jgi:hypothetical protein|nr:hypothetical protein [Tannerella sp.]